MFGVRGPDGQAADQELSQPGTKSGTGGPGAAAAQSADDPGAAAAGPEGGGTGPGHGGPGRGGRARGGAGQPAHGAARRDKSRVALLAAVAVAVIAGGAVYTLMHGRSAHQAAAHQPARAGHGTAAALTVLSVTPGPGTRQVDGSAPVMVQFSAPLAAGSPEPVIRPAVAGSWSQVGDDATFTPARPLRPGSTFTVTVPAGHGGVRTVTEGILARPMAARFTTRGYSPVRLAQLLGQLGYLPLTWSPTQATATRAAEMTTASSVVSQASLAYDPPAGGFTWQPGYPATLASAWWPGRASLVLQGAIMAFRSEHGMLPNGIVNGRLWSALFTAVKKNDRNANGYTYAVASKALPETLTIWHDGHVVFHSLANTGIPVSPTVDGTFPVYERFPFQIMRGTNPDGSSYADPVSFVSYFNGGDAVHYFPRGSYGFQQSLGCVELPYSAAEQAYPYLTYGSLVTVAG